MTASSVWENVKWWISTLAIPLALGLVGYQYERANSQRQESDARLRLYTELLSKREEADTGVRRAIFDKVLETYLKPEQEKLDERLVALELLALNFHESLNLSPLFSQIDREIARSRASDEDKGRMRDHLNRIVNGVKARQVALLELFGAKQDATVVFESVGRSDKPLIGQPLKLRDPDALPGDSEKTRQFYVDVLEHDAGHQRVLVRLQVDEIDQQWVVWVGPMSFPLVDFIRISKSERVAIVMTAYDEVAAELTLVYFPSSRSGVKDKPFIDDVISRLRRASQFAP
jgi:hypothetical protein